MAIGTYNTTRPATVDPKDVEVFYTFAPNRETRPSAPIPLDAATILTAEKDGDGLKMGGMYTLRLPASDFNRLGIYNLYLRPRQIRSRILDCGVLAAIPDHKGIVIDAGDLVLDQDKLVPGGLQGFRVEYIETGGILRSNYFTVCAWSNRSEVVAQNIGNTTQTSRAYRFNTVGNLVFLSLTPSTSHSVNDAVKPYLGIADQEVILTNPFFDAQHLEVELVEHDFNTVATAIFGNQTRSIRDGVVSTYKTVDGEEQIFAQHSLYILKDPISGKALYEVREKLSDVDDSKRWEDVTTAGVIRNE